MFSTRTFLMGILVALALSLYQCSPSNPVSQTETIRPPFSSFSVPVQEHQVDPKVGATLEFETGSRITIGSNSLVDAEGNTITAPVTIAFREFHTLADVLASGIPMRYDSAGAEGHMVTAGMFELQATTASGQEVFIDADHPVDVQLASFQEGPQYNTYCLNEEKGEWQYLETTAPSKNEAKIVALDTLAKRDTLVAPKAPIAFAKGTPVLDLKPNYERLPELKPFHGVVWQHGGEGPNYLETEWFYELPWANVDLERQGQDFTYKATFKSKDTTLTMVLQPVFSEADYEKALTRFETLETAYSSNKEAIRGERSRLENQADLMRSMQVSNFGFYNYDRIYKQKSTVHLAANFDFGKHVDPDISKINVFLVVESANAVINFPTSQWSLFNFDPNEEHKILAVLPGDKIAYLSARDFRALSINKAQHDNTDYTFKMNLADGAISSVDDLQQFLDQI
ncbi:MAG: hypothetical protein ACFB10_21995 [Salibacteraceae bacterium]